MDDEFRDWITLILKQYKLALEGKRPIFCTMCRRPYRARQEGRGIFPYLHARYGSRDVCSGSYIVGALK